MDSHWLLDGSPWLRLLATSVVLLPALLILCSRRCRSWPRKILWSLATQLPWLFVVFYAWVSSLRYADSSDPMPPLSDALGWWMLAFPWAVYLLYRASRRHLAGDSATRGDNPDA